MEKSYERTQRLLVTMRREGQIPYYRIVDRSRPKHHKTGWDGARDIVEACAVQYRRNRWADQDTVAMIALEKQALEGVFAEVVDEYGVGLWTLKGYPSLSYLYDWSNEIRRLTSSGKAVVIYYFGDHDPSGLSIEDASIRGLDELDATFTWERRGLLFGDFSIFDLVNVPVKITDSRSRDYLEKYGNRAGELDALPPIELQDRIRAAIETEIEWSSWGRMLEAEAAEKESIELVSANWGRALAAVRGAA